MYIYFGDVHIFWPGSLNRREKLEDFLLVDGRIILKE
jgi:hypothetical protein